MPQKGTKKVSFEAVKVVSKPVKIEFNTKAGRVAFTVKQSTRKPIVVKFYTKKK